MRPNPRACPCQISGAFLDVLPQCPSWTLLTCAVTRLVWTALQVDILVKISILIHTKQKTEAAMRVSERGQVTIPKEIREQFGFGANTEVEFVVREGRVELVRSPKSTSEKIDTIYGKKRFTHGTDELMRLLRQ